MEDSPAVRLRWRMLKGEITAAVAPDRIFLEYMDAQYLIREGTETGRTRGVFSHV